MQLQSTVYRGVAVQEVLHGPLVVVVPESQGKKAKNQLLIFQTVRFVTVERAPIGVVVQGPEKPDERSAVQGNPNLLGMKCGASCVKALEHQIYTTLVVGRLDDSIIHATIVRQE